MEELYFLGLHDLDRPLHKVDTETLFSFHPFYDDYYVVIYLKKTRSGYKPIIINDRDLVSNYGATNLPDLVMQIIATGEKIHSYTYKINYRILVLFNGWWCVYIEKRHIWESFESKAVITIMSPSKTAVIDFFQTYFAPKLEKRKITIKRDIPVPQLIQPGTYGILQPQTTDHKPNILDASQQSARDYKEADSEMPSIPLVDNWEKETTPISFIEEQSHINNNDLGVTRIEDL